MVPQSKYIKKLSKKDKKKKFNEAVFKEYVKIGKRDSTLAFSEDVQKGKAAPSVITEAQTIAKNWGTRKGSNIKIEKAKKNVLSRLKKKKKNYTNQ